MTKIFYTWSVIANPHLWQTHFSLPHTYFSLILQISCVAMVSKDFSCKRDTHSKTQMKILQSIPVCTALHRPLAYLSVLQVQRYETVGYFKTKWFIVHNVYDLRFIGVVVGIFILFCESLQIIRPSADTACFVTLWHELIKYESTVAFMTFPMHSLNTTYRQLCARMYNFAENNCLWKAWISHLFSLAQDIKSLGDWRYWPPDTNMASRE